MEFAERREITALCYDLVASTDLLAHSDLEEFEQVISGFQRRSSAAIRAHGGSMEDTLGDGGIAFFGYPVPTEDNATAAILAGLEIIQACKRLASETGREDLHVRIGIATSEVIVREVERGVSSGVTGVAPALASRLQVIASPDTVVVSERTQRLARGNFVFQHLGSQMLKGFSESIKVWSVKRRVIGAMRLLTSGRLGARMVGREIELQQALDLWRRASAGEGQTLVICGEAGIGKSRLAYEVFRHALTRRARSLVLQCPFRGAETALSPLVELIRSAATASGESGEVTFESVAALMRRQGILDDAVIATMAFAIGVPVPLEHLTESLGPAQFRERIAWAARSYLEAWLRDRPAIILLEDVQWIDPTSEDLLRNLVDWARNNRILLILTARERRPWMDVVPQVTVMELTSLAEAEAEQLVSNLLPGRNVKTLPPRVLSLIYQRTDGIPLYLEELAQWLETAADPDPANLLTGLSNAPIRSLESALSARLGSLGPAKAVAQAAAVVGRGFNEHTLHEILPQFELEQLSAILGRLVVSNILVPEQHSLQPTYAFRHSLIQETLDGTLLRKSRIELHQRCHVAAAAGRLPMPEAAMGVHAQQAGLFEEAAQHFIAAAKESFSRSAVVEARQLLDRAFKLLPQIKDADDRERLELSALAALGPILTSTAGLGLSCAIELKDTAEGASEFVDLFDRIVNVGGGPERAFRVS